MNQDYETKTDNKSKVNLLSYIGSFIAVLIPGAYIIGLFFHRGYLEGAGIDAKNFSISAHEAYVQAYHATTWAVMVIIDKLLSCINYIYENIYFAILIAILLITASYLVIKLSKKIILIKENKIILILKKILFFIHWKNNDLTKVVSVYGVVSYGVVLLIYMIMFIALFWCLLPYAAHKKGYNISQEAVSKYVENGCGIESNNNWYNCITLLDGDRTEIIKGLFITRDKNQIAVFDGKKGKVIKLPNQYYIEKRIYKKPTSPTTLDW